MSLIVRFVFIGEGTSDASLVIPLTQLCKLCGADDAKEILLPLHQFGSEVGHSIFKKARVVLSQASNADILFIHRDADARDATSRYKEIATAMESLGNSMDYVAVVPIQETEAWLLLDEKAIREVAENQAGRMSLNLPSPKQVETIANPKERLKEVLAKASGFKGRRLKRFRKNFSLHRRELLEMLDCEGPVSKVAAFRRLVDDISQAIEKLKRRAANG
jgi:hypothetical protein